MQRLSSNFASTKEQAKNVDSDECSVRGHTQDTLYKLTFTMPKQMQVMMEAKGGST